MAFKLKRHRRSSKESKLLKRLKVLKAKVSLTVKQKAEIKKILIALNKGPTDSIESKKLNNNKQNEINITKAIYNGDDDLSNLNMGHLQSTSGSYRRGRIDNKKT